MSMDYSKVFGPTAATAAGATIGSAAELLNVDVTIYEIRVALANVVDAKEISGKIAITATGLDGTHEYAFGGGQGGATNSGTMPAEVIKCSIPISANSKVTITGTAAETLADCTVSLGFTPGRGRNVRSYYVGGAGQDTTADTNLALTTSPVMEEGGRIVNVRCCACGGVTDAKAGTAKLYIDVPGLSGPFEYAVGGGAGGAANAQNNIADNIDLPRGIPVKKNDTIAISITSAEIVLSAAASIQVA